MTTTCTPNAATHKDFINQFLDLSLTSLTEIERDDLHRSLKSYQRTHDLAKLAKSCSPLLRSANRARLLHYIRAPMTMPERLQFDRLLGIQDRTNNTFANNRVGPASPLLLDAVSLNQSMKSHSHQGQGPERYVTIEGTRGQSMGFSIRGGSEFGLGIYISAVRKKSPSGEAGLCVGDQILSTNGVDFSSLANSSAVKVLSSSAVLHLKIQRCGRVPEWKVAKQRILWYDVALCKVVRAPPFTECHDLTSTYDKVVEQKVIINVGDNSDAIGLNIRGGSEYGVGIYVSRVDSQGLAHRAGISSGDQIVQVNEVSFEKIDHSEAVDVLRSSSNLITTIRSVGKYPVFKELCAEYTWTNVDNALSDKTTTRELSKWRVQRTRARESSIDLTSFHGYPLGRDNQGFEGSDVEELDDGLEVQTELCYPKNHDIMFKRNDEDSWKHIDSLDNRIKTEEDSRNWSADTEDSLGYYLQDSDFSDNNMDYTSFLEKNKHPDINGQNNMNINNNNDNNNYNTNGVQHSPRDDETLVIETVIEEDVTSFASKKAAPAPAPPNKGYNMVSAGVKTAPFYPPNYGEPKTATIRSINSNSSSTDISVHSGNSNGYKQHRHGSGKSSRAPDVPLSNSSSAGSDVTNGDVDNITSQIKQLEARKSHLGTWEITRVAGSSSASLPSSPELASDSEKSRSSWSTFKARIKGSLRNKGPKKRLSLPSEAEFIGRNSKQSSPQDQKGGLGGSLLFEKGFGSQINTNHVTDRYNLMAVLEDHARKILSEDECKAVIRHINNYHDNKDLERLVQLLLAILDKDEKQVLLIDVRGVVQPSQLEKYDQIMDRCHIQGYNTTTWNRSHTNLNSIDGPIIVQKKPAPPVPTDTPVNDLDLTDEMSEFASFSKDDFKNEPEHLELIILERDDRDNAIVLPSRHVDASQGQGHTDGGYEDFDGVETVYISKHKNFLGLELCGGQDDPVDKVIRVKDVLPGGAASDDRRIQPGIEVTEIDGKTTKGLTMKEASAILETTFSNKTPVNLGIEIRHSYHL